MKSQFKYNLMICITILLSVCIGMPVYAFEEENNDELMIEGSLSENEIDCTQKDDPRSNDDWHITDMSGYLYQEGALGFEKEIYQEYADSPVMGNNVSENDEFEKMITDAIDNDISDPIDIDVSEYCYSEDELLKHLVIIINDNPQYYYIDSKYDYQKDDFVNKLRLHIKDDFRNDRGSSLGEEDVVGEAQYEPHQNDKEFIDAVTDILKQIDDDWSDEEKALWVHDYLCTTADYDYTYTKYSAYNILVEHSGVCNAYSLAYDYLMDKLDIPCGKVTSQALNHAWNLIQLGDKFYYVDVTWDDLGGYSCYHSDFLRSKQGMINTGHDSTDWMNYAYPAYENDVTSTDRDNYYWSEANRAIPNIGRKWAYVKKYPDTNIYVHDYNTGMDSLFSEFAPVTWYVWSPGNWSRYYPKNFMSLVSLGNHLAVSFPQQVFLINGSGAVVDEYELSDTEKNSGFIYGIQNNDGKVKYTIATSPYSDDVTGYGSINWSNYYTKAKKNCHYIYAYAGKNGSISPEGYIRAQDGGSITITATPKDGYQVRAYILNGNEIISNENSFVIKDIRSDNIVSVEFEEHTGDSGDKEDQSDDPKSKSSSSSSRHIMDVGEYTILTKMKASLCRYFPNSLGVTRYVSSDRKCATISKAGILKAKKPGNITILGQKWNGRRYLTVAEMAIEVQKPKLRKMSMNCGKKYINAMDYLSGTTWTPVSWKSSDTCIATVDSYGRIYARNPGKCTITAYFGNGCKVKARAKLTVY